MAELFEDNQAWIRDSATENDEKRLLITGGVGDVMLTAVVASLLESSHSGERVVKKEENIVSYTMDELKAEIAKEGLGITERFHTMTDEELEEIVKNDPDEPAYYENRKEVTVHLDKDLMQFIEQRHLNIDASVNAALRQYVGHISQ